jgi:hypothetical protein
MATAPGGTAGCHRQSKIPQNGQLKIPQVWKSNRVKPLRAARYKSRFSEGSPMFTLEDFMNVRDLKQQGLSVSAIARQLNIASLPPILRRGGGSDDASAVAGEARFSSDPPGSAPSVHYTKGVAVTRRTGENPARLLLPGEAARRHLERFLLTQINQDFLGCTPSAKGSQDSKSKIARTSKEKLY